MSKLLILITFLEPLNLYIYIWYLHYLIYFKDNLFDLFKYFYSYFSSHKLLMPG